MPYFVMNVTSKSSKLWNKLRDVDLYSHEQLSETVNHSSRLIPRVCRLMQHKYSYTISDVSAIYFLFLIILLADFIICTRTPIILYT